MTAYGGLGGIWNGRDFDPEDPFEAAVARALDLSDQSLAEELAGAMVNRPWAHQNGDTADYSMRAGGDLIVAVRRHQGCAEDGENYCRWYLCGAATVVTPRVAEALVKEGWTAFTDDQADAWCERDLDAANLWDADFLKKWMAENGDKPFEFKGPGVI